MGGQYKYAKYIILIIIASVAFIAYGQIMPTKMGNDNACLVEHQDTDLLIDSIQVKKRIEAGIKKYGKENIKQVLQEMLYEDLKKIVESQGPNPMDVLYDKMITDLSDEAGGKANDAVNTYSKAFADSLMWKLYYNHNAGKREQMYKAAGINLISAAFCKCYNTKDPTDRIVAYDNVLLFKNYEIYNQKAIRENFQDPVIHEYYVKYCKDLDSLNYSNNQDEYTRCIWESSVEHFGRDAVLHQTPIPKFSDIKRSIPPRSTLVEFCDTHIAGKSYMCAYIIKNTSAAPDVVIFDVPDTLKRAITDTQNSTNINALYGSDQLYKTFIEPLLPYIEGETLYVAPSSYVSFVNFSAIKHGTVYLPTEYRVVRLFSGADLVDNNHSTPLHNAALFGGIKYDMSPKEIADESSRFVAMRSSDRGHLGSLPNSLTEIKQINSIFQTSKIPAITTECFFDKEASEAQFKSFDGNSPDIIHLATHGYYLNAEDRLKHTYLKNSGFNSSMMLFNGLLLSGATLAWNNGTPTPGVEDGILTSEEISRMDLSKTQLVVMSACCTALGDYNEVEGVFGLQRAFKQAGVKNQISTLWPVHDGIARNFMTSFYSNYVKTQSIYAAYNQSLDEIKALYPTPYYWAAFVLLGE